MHSSRAPSYTIEGHAWLRDHMVNPYRLADSISFEMDVGWVMNALLATMKNRLTAFEKQAAEIFEDAVNYSNRDSVNYSGREDDKKTFLTKIYEGSLPANQRNFIKQPANKVKTAFAFSGVYTQTDLRDYFLSLFEAVKQHERQLGHALPLMLSFGDYTIGVIFNAAIDRWGVIDVNLRLKEHHANVPKTAYFTRINDLIRCILAIAEDRLKNTEDYLLLHTRCFATHASLENIDTIIQAWQNSGAFKQIHKITEEKIQYSDSSHCTWLKLAAQEGDAPTVLRLCQALEVNIRVSRSNNIITALENAIKHGYLAAVKILLEAGARVEPSRVDQPSPLYLAASYGQDDIVTFLLNKEANVDLIQSPDGTTALHGAIGAHNVNAARLLLEAGANQFIMASNGAGTPLECAQHNRDQEMIELLERYRKLSPQSSAHRQHSLFSAASLPDQVERPHNRCCVMM